MIRMKARDDASRLLREAAGASALIDGDVPSMINPSEQAFIYSLARDYVRGEGVIVDAGIFMGASTRVFAAGLRDRPDKVDSGRWGKPIKSYDLALCDGCMAPIINDRYGTSLQDGDSFLPILWDNIRGCEDLIEFFPGDIRDHAVDAPIEVLFLDVCKTPEINTYIANHFFPKLIPGRSVVIQQDYVHEWLPWIHVAMGAFDEYFEPLGQVGDSPSVAWLNTRQIPKVPAWGQDGRDPYHDAPRDELLRHFEVGTRSLTRPVSRYWVELAKARLIADRGDPESALRLLDQLKDRFEQLESRPCHLPHPTLIEEYIAATRGDQSPDTAIP